MEEVIDARLKNAQNLLEEELVFALLMVVESGANTKLAPSLPKEELNFVKSMEVASDVNSQLAKHLLEEVLTFAQLMEAEDVASFTPVQNLRGITVASALHMEVENDA
mmetsp:Transcript_20230/g.24530  ORF Transcript_20230/g.24530 Transcript_20230/m.24530 type:complete len:108 (+) Transcript_20230:198-521(+)